MPARLSVVMVQTAPPSRGATQLAEAVVGELIGMPEIDLTLIGSLSTIASDSTDRLTLESLTGDLAILTWQTPADCVAALVELGVPGQRVPHEHDRQASPGGSPVRRIYAFDLTQFTTARQVCDALADLKAKRQVRTFSLLTPPEARPANPVQATDSGAEQVSGEEPKGQDGHPTRSQNADSKTPTAINRSLPQRPDASPRLASEPAPGTEAGPASESRPNVAVDLDDLLDQLDDLDP